MPGSNLRRKWPDRGRERRSSFASHHAGDDAEPVGEGGGVVRQRAVSISRPGSVHPEGGGSAGVDRREHVGRQLLQLVDVRDNPVELPGPERQVGFRHLEAGKGGDPAHDLRSHRRGAGGHPKIVSRKTNFAVSRVREKVREGITTLAEEKDLAEVARIAARRGERVWIVGGALRDLALGREVPEVDVAVDGDAGAIAKEMEFRGHGRAVLLSGDRKPRVFRVAGRVRTVDLAEIEGESIETDLARRDFTANALAVELPAGTLLDPHGGAADLWRRRLRMVSEKNLGDDPLRSVRAARFMATHGLTPDRETSRAARRAGEGLGRVAGERLQVELSKLLEASRAAPALVWAATNGLLGPALRIPLPAARWRRIARDSAALDALTARKLPRDRRRRLRLAFLAGRAGLSGRGSASALRGARWGTAESGEVAWLLDLAAAASKSRGGEEDWRWLLGAGESATDALRLLELLQPRRRRNVRRLRAKVSRKRPVPEIRGADVLEWTGIRPGPEVGRLLEAVRVAALSGRVRDREDARRWLESRRESGSKSRPARPPNSYPL